MGWGCHKSTRDICCVVRVLEIGADGDGADGAGAPAVLSRLTSSVRAWPTLLNTMADLRMMSDSGKRNIDTAYLKQNTIVVTHT